MFLSKRWILLLISITGISFLILLFIQFGWTRKSIEINRRHFDNRMMVICNKIDDAFLKDKAFQKTYLFGSAEIKNFTATTAKGHDIENTVKRKVDSILKAEKAPMSSEIIGRTGRHCYLMNYVPENLHNSELDHSPYKICLCNNSYPVGLDIGISLVSYGNMLGADSYGLILPSIVLILLLIALFAYAIYIINRQKKLSGLKNDFINSLTHEFNTPLFSIGLTSNLLLRSEAIGHSDKLKNYVELIATEKNRIQSQVDKILKLTAIESGSFIMEKEIIDMDELIKENIKSFETGIKEKGGVIIFNTHATHYFVNGDRLHLYNTISNVLDNAFKYSDKPPEIEIETSNRDRELLIHISDKGIGMTKAQANLIFDKFYRVKQGDRHDIKGFGLGLSYVKKVIELHNGAIEVKTSPGQGSVFIIHLPYHD